MDNGLVSLIFPTYNPGADLERCWSEVQRFLSEAPGRWEVLYVCDGCTDGTEQRLRQWARDAEHPVRVLSYAPNHGKGRAVRTGLREAAGDWRIFTDIDLSYGLDGVLRVAKQLRQGADVVIGSRLHPDSHFVVPTTLQDYAYRRRIQSWCFMKLARCLLPLETNDPQGGLKGFSARAVQGILPYLGCDGFSFDCELLMACRHCGFHVTEVPVGFRYRDVTTTGLRKTLRMVGDLWSVRRSLRRWTATAATERREAPTSRAA